MGQQFPLRTLLDCLRIDPRAGAAYQHVAGMLRGEGVPVTSPADAAAMAAEWTVPDLVDSDHSGH